MNSFDHSPQCDELTSYEPTAEDLAEYNAWLDNQALYNQARNAWQDREDDLQQGEDDRQLFYH